MASVRAGRAPGGGPASGGTRDPSAAPPVAIVGIGCRFPGGISTPDQFWELLLRGGDAITEAPPGRLDLDTLYDPDPSRPGTLYARWGGYVDGIDRFDAEFFGISPREAHWIDPQQRLLLEVVWEALEDGGQPPDALGGSDTGVFIGISGHDYADLEAQPGARGLIDVHTSPGGATSIAANRISYLLDLRGPSLAVDTACSSALTAVHLACASLAAGECGIALVGAVNALITPEPTIGFCKAGMLSREGCCKPFDARADGYVRSEGAGAVVLKPLDRALRDEDPIYAVIRGTGVNQDGRTQGISVPNPAAQQALIEQVLARAGVDRADLCYIEAHGTGTPVGDPREAQAIGAVMAGRPADRPCLIGSVKGNLGHLEAAAGIVGLLKTALIVGRRQIPPTIHFQQPNPAIDFERLRLRVPTAVQPWPGDAGSPAIAGVNSFGFGGANAHATLQEPPARPARSARADEHHIVPLSARSPEALRALAGAWLEHLDEKLDDDAPALGDLAYTAAVRRAHHQHRLAVVGGTRAEVAARLAGFAAGGAGGDVAAGRARDHEPRLAFVFSGMGPQWWGMGRELLRDEPVFAEHIVECDRLLLPLAGWSLGAELVADEQSTRVTEPFLAHVANLAVQTGLAALWRSWGIVPDAVVGHSSGEMAAACVAGELSLADAVRLAYHRGRLQHRTAGTGGMLAAGIAPETVPGLLEGLERRVSLAAVNGPSSVTLSGERGALQELATSLEGRGSFARMLPVTVPYHGPQMDGLRDELLEALADLAPRTATIPVVSTVTGDWRDGRPVDAAYWWRNVREPVRFAAAVDRLLTDGCEVFVELAPHPVLSPTLRECLSAGGSDGAVLPTLRRGAADRTTMLGSLAEMYVRGRRIDWRGVLGPGRVCVPLPRYPWQRERHWLPEPPPPPSPGRDSGHPLLGRRLPVARPTWQAELGDPRLDYLAGHVVQGSVTFPGAGHVELALAASRAWRGDGPVALEDVGFHRLLPLEERNATALQCLVDTTTSTIEIHSARLGESSDWTLRASTRLAALRPGDPPAVDLAAVRERCATPVDVDVFYRELGEGHGLRYEGAFRSVASLWTGDGEALGSLALPDAAVAAGEHVVHPALLDAAFQVLGAAALRPDARDVLLPVAIARVEFHGSPGPRLLTHARVTGSGPGVVEGTVTLMDEDGRVALQCTGLRLQLLAQQRAESLADWLYQGVWEPVSPPGGAAAAIPSAGETAAALGPVLDRRAAEYRLEEYYTTVEPALNALAMHFVRDTLRHLGLDAGRDAGLPVDALAERLGIVARQRRFFGRLLELAGEGTVPPAGAPDLDRTYPEYGCAIRLIRESGRRLAGTLRGSEDAREWLVAGDSLDDVAELYGSSPVFAVYLTVVADAVAAAHAACAPRPVRILEVGAGTGGATGLVLAKLPPGGCEYLFTDVSPFFLKAARERFAGRPEFTTRVLDVEHPPADIGVFDVIVAADVVHATADLRSTVDNLRDLLAPGGQLVMLEAVRRSAWLDLIVGQLEGWWRATDRDLRPDHPLLGIEPWTEVLADSGFAGAAHVTDAGGADGVPSQVVLLATAAPAPAPPRPARSWLVLTDRRGVGPEVAADLRARGDVCTLAWPGTEYRRFGDDGIELVPWNPADWASLLRDVHGVDGVIGLWALDAPAEPSGAAELMAFQETSCGWVVALLQALVSVGRPLPDDVWLVTAGAQFPAEDESGAAGVAQSPLWGLGRVLRTEQGGGRCRLVDLSAGCTEDDVTALLGELELPPGDREEELAFRGGRRLARRLRPAALGPRPGDRVVLETDRAAFRLTVGRPGALETLDLRETAPQDPGAGEIAIRVVAAALNFRDVLVALGVGFAVGGQDPAEAPFGWECAGVVVAVGDGVADVSVGDEVVGIAAGAIGSRTVTRADRVAPKPACLGFEEAATLPVAFLTAHWALERLAHLAPGERVLIHCASGGIGLAAVQIAQRVGARVFTTAGTDEKREHLRALGVEYVGDSRALDFADEVLEATAGEGVDVVLNSLAGEAIDRGLRVLRPYGRFVEIGKRDIYEGGRLDLAPFRRNLSYFALDLLPLYDEEPAVIGRLLRSILRDVETGSLRPLPHHDFDLSEGEQAVRLMAQARHIGKVVLTAHESRYAVVPAHVPGLARGDGAYVITGGLGGFGLAVAAWLVREGAGAVVLMSRSGVPHEDDAAALEALRSSPARIEVVIGDVTDGPAMAGILDHVRATIAPIRGVVHAAMVLDDALLGRLDQDRFQAVLAPKVAGAWNLHELTAADELDMFVLFSSISAVIGQPAQGGYAAANEFLGALSAHRRATGRPSLTVDWGAITGAGYVARHPELVEGLHRHGLRGISPEDACAALAELLRQGVRRMCVSSVDWAARDTGAARRQDDAAGMAGAGGSGAPTGTGAETLVTRLAAGSPADRAAAVEQYLLRVTARVLETTPERIDVDRRLPDLGIDSLMAVELRTALRADLGVEVPIVDLLEQLSVRRLARTVAERLDGHAAAR